MATVLSPLSYTVKVNGADYTLNLTSAPEQMIHQLIAQGAKIILQRATARGADEKMSPSEMRDAIAAKAKELNDGTWRANAGGGGGAKLDDLEREFRAMLVAAFKAGGVKHSDAVKYAAHEDRLDYYHDSVIVSKLRTVAPDRLSQSPEIARKNFNAILAKATETVEARNAAADLDLDI